MSTVRLMSQNLWNCTKNREEWEALGLDCSAEVRMNGHMRVFEELMPDIVGCQEFNKDMLLYFGLNCHKLKLPYTVVWGNMTPLIYRADRFELLDVKYLLYPHAVEGYEGTANDYNSKSVNAGVFRCKESGGVFVFATTHLWWMSEANREGSDRVRRIQVEIAADAIDSLSTAYGSCPAFFVGDMNTRVSSPPMQYLLNERGFVHTHDIATKFRHEGRGYNGCGKNGPGKWQDMPFETSIDHILVKNGCGVEIKRFDRYCPDYYLFLSDHAPVFVDAEL